MSSIEKTLFLFFFFFWNPYFRQLPHYRPWIAQKKNYRTSSARNSSTKEEYSVSDSNKKRPGFWSFPRQTFSVYGSVIHCDTPPQAKWPTHHPLSGPHLHCFSSTRKYGTPPGENLPIYDIANLHLYIHGICQRFCVGTLSSVILILSTHARFRCGAGAVAGRRRWKWRKEAWDWVHALTQLQHRPQDERQLWKTGQSRRSCDSASCHVTSIRAGFSWKEQVAVL